MSRFFFRYCWWIAFAAAPILVAGGLASGLPDRGALIGGGLAIIFGFCYFAQQQRLAEITLFKQLFTEFNERYDKLNDDLAKIESPQVPLTLDSRQKVVDYFNLCAEEYLFYSEGYIHHEVWKTWCLGMLYYIEKEPFAKIWAEESDKKCYYGLTKDKINKGAG